MFEKFIDVCLEYYDLDPCHYFSSPGLAWDVMLRMTGIELELISDVDMHLFIEKGMRGGISYIAKRYCRTNNNYVKGYDDLYAWAMTQYLPYGGFKWMNKEKIDDFDFNLVRCDNCEEYILEVQLEYPDSLNNFHNDYP